MLAKVCFLLLFTFLSYCQTYAVENQRELALSSDLTVSPGDEVKISIYIDNASDVVAYRIGIAFPGTDLHYPFTFVQESMTDEDTLTAAWPPLIQNDLSITRGFVVVTNIAGVNPPLSPTSGALVQFHIQVNSNAAPGTYRLAFAESITRINDGAIPISMAHGQITVKGPDYTPTPAPTSTPIPSPTPAPIHTFTPTIIPTPTPTSAWYPNQRRLTLEAPQTVNPGAEFVVSVTVDNMIDVESYRIGLAMEPLEPAYPFTYVLGGASSMGIETEAWGEPIESDYSTTRHYVLIGGAATDDPALPKGAGTLVQFRIQVKSSAVPGIYILAFDRTVTQLNNGAIPLTYMDESIVIQGAAATPTPSPTSAPNQRKLTLPKIIAAIPGEEISIPVIIDNAQNLIAYRIGTTIPSNEPEYPFVYVKRQFDKRGNAHRNLDRSSSGRSYRNEWISHRCRRNGITTTSIQQFRRAIPIHIKSQIKRCARNLSARL